MKKFAAPALALGLLACSTWSAKAESLWSTLQPAPGAVVNDGATAVSLADPASATTSLTADLPTLQVFNYHRAPQTVAETSVYSDKPVFPTAGPAIIAPDQAVALLVGLTVVGLGVRRKPAKIRRRRR